MMMVRSLGSPAMAGRSRAALLSAVAHFPDRQDTPVPQSESDPQPPPAAAHLPDRHVPRPQSESEPQVPSGALAHLPDRHEAPPQSESDPQEDPAAVAHFPDRQDTPAPQSEFDPQVEPPARLRPARKPMHSATDNRRDERIAASRGCLRPV